MQCGDGRCLDGGLPRGENTSVRGREVDDHLVGQLVVRPRPRRHGPPHQSPAVEQPHRDQVAVAAPGAQRRGGVRRPRPPVPAEVPRVQLHRQPVVLPGRQGRDDVGQLRGGRGREKDGHGAESIARRRGPQRHSSTAADTPWRRGRTCVRMRDAVAGTGARRRGRRGPAGARLGGGPGAHRAHAGVRGHHLPRGTGPLGAEPGAGHLTGAVPVDGQPLPRAAPTPASTASPARRIPISTSTPATTSTGRSSSRPTSARCCGASWPARPGAARESPWAPTPTPTNGPRAATGSCPG